MILMVRLLGLLTFVSFVVVYQALFTTVGIFPDQYPQERRAEKQKRAKHSHAEKDFDL